MLVTLWDVMVRYLPFRRVALEAEIFVLGAHSWVRKTLGITMDGEQTGQLIDTTSRPAVTFTLFFARLHLGRCRHHSRHGFPRHS